MNRFFIPIVLSKLFSHEAFNDWKSKGRAEKRKESESSRLPRKRESIFPGDVESCSLRP